MAPRVALNQNGPSPERQALAQAARRYQDLVERDKALGEALAGIETDLADARRELAQAEQRVEEAEAAAVTARIEAALGGDTDPPALSATDARMAVVVIKDRLDTLNAAKTKLTVATGPLSQQMIWALTALREAVRAVVRTDPATAALVDRLEITRAQFITLQSAVEYLALQGMLPERSGLSTVPQTSEIELRWRAAVAALEAGDISTVLPWDNSEGNL